MRVAALFAGGKDSTYAIYKALKNGFEVKYLLTMISKNPYSWMFHTVNINVTPYQAKAMGIRQLMRYTSGEKDTEVENLKEAISVVKNDIDGVLSGVITSSYQKSRIDRICKQFGLKSIVPLWGRKPRELLQEFIAEGFEAIVTSVSAEGFDKNWLGRKIDEECLEDLKKLHNKFGIDISAEGGEYESLVLDAPFFNKRIGVIEVERIWQRDSGYLLVKKAKLVDKRRLSHL
jgi:ABC transporter with metal-binding/Fe-S-binding domain ATP-binding protein